MSSGLGKQFVFVSEISRLPSQYGIFDLFSLRFYDLWIPFDMCDDQHLISNVCMYLSTSTQPTQLWKSALWTKSLLLAPALEHLSEHGLSVS